MFEILALYCKLLFHGSMIFLFVSKRHLGLSVALYFLENEQQRISGKGVPIYKGMGGHFADFISFFLNFP